MLIIGRIFAWISAIVWRGVPLLDVDIFTDDRVVTLLSLGVGSPLSLGLGFDARTAFFTVVAVIVRMLIVGFGISTVNLLMGLKEVRGRHFFREVSSTFAKREEGRGKGEERERRREKKGEGGKRGPILRPVV